MDQDNQLEGIHPGADMQLEDILQVEDNHGEDIQPEEDNHVGRNLAVGILVGNNLAVGILVGDILVVGMHRGVEGMLHGVKGNIQHQRHMQQD